MNRGMQIRRSVPFFAKSVNPQIFLVKSEIVICIGQVHVNSTVPSNLAQIVKNVTCLMKITQYNSNNSITPEFK